MAILGAGLATSQWKDSLAGDSIARNQALSGNRQNDATYWNRELSSARQRLNSSKRQCQSACEARAKHLASRLGSGFTVLVRSPFVLAGDQGGANLVRVHEEIVLPAALALYLEYLDRTPDQPVTIVVMRDYDSYQRVARGIFDTNPPDFGFYSPRDHSLVINGDTGSGTLVHELTHALVHFDFPNMPCWFNEGLASLHEECRVLSTSKTEPIEGLSNWRLDYLRQPLTRGTLRPLVSLMRDAEFRGPNQLENYALARYFCLYLQDLGHLQNFYRELRNNAQTDPCGEQTAMALLGSGNWKRMDNEFQDWLAAISEKSLSNSPPLSVAMRIR